MLVVYGCGVICSVRYIPPDFTSVDFVAVWYGRWYMRHSDKQRPLAVVGAIHGNELLFGTQIVASLQERPQRGIVGHMGHTAALARGVRFCTPVGEGGIEIGGLMPGDKQSTNPDMRAAGDLYDWLKHHNPWATVSFHCNNGQTPGSEFMSTGRITRRSILALANLADVRTVAIDPSYAFYKCRPEVIEVEQIVTSKEHGAQLAATWLDRLKQMSKGPKGMAELYDPKQLTFYVRGGTIWLVNKDGSRNNAVWENIEALEQAVGHVERFAPLRLPQQLAEKLGLEGLRLVMSSWDSRNNSAEIPEAGVSSVSGKPRRQVFGAWYVVAKPPRPTGNGDQLAFSLPSR